MLLFGSFCGGSELDDEIKNFENFSNVYHLILQDYVEEKSKTELIHSAIEGMVKSLDPYSEILTKEELDDLELSSVGKYAGVGIHVQKKNRLFVVTQVFKSSPAELAGLEPGDVLVKINDIHLAGKSDIELQRMVQGEKGTVLHVSYYKKDDPIKVLVQVMERDWIIANSVDFFKSESDIGILRIYQFIKQTPKEVKSYLSGKKFGALIIDLRNNPGGLLLSAVETAEQFLSIGPIVETRNRNDEVMEKYISNRAVEEDQPFLVVLINRYSASAAEILAGALKDRKVATIVGEKSFGKGVVQSVYPLNNEIFVKLTTARYYTPGGLSFHGKGIQPDIEIADTLGTARYDKSDTIYQQALKIARNRSRHP